MILFWNKNTFHANSLDVTVRASTYLVKRWSDVTREQGLRLHRDDSFIHPPESENPMNE